MEKQLTKFDKAVKISIVAGILIVALSVAYYLIILPWQKGKIEVVKDKNSENDEIKKQSFEKFYNDLGAAIENNNWNDLYKFEPKSVQEAITREEYIAFQQKTIGDPKYFSRNTEIKEIKIDGNKAMIHRIVTTCITQECEENNKMVDDRSREYELVNGKWQVPDLDPTERSISVAASIYLEYISKDDKNKKAFFEKFSYGKESMRLALRNYAKWLDDNMEQLVYLEKILENKGTTQGNPSINFNTPSINAAPLGTIDVSSALEQANKKSEEKCKQDMEKYNSCIVEYNADLSEYNVCLTRNSDPTQTIKSYCSKPLKMCSKPYCAY